MWLWCVMCLAWVFVSVAPAFAFEADTSPQPATHPPLSPADGAVAITNPPSMIWRVDERAATYAVEMCQGRRFDRDVIRVDGIDMPFYNHSATLADGTWYWRYFVIAPGGERSEPSPVRSFVIAAESIALPVPATQDILAHMPPHPRIFVTPDALAEFRRRRDGPAKQAWEHLRYGVSSYLDAEAPRLKLQPMREDPGKSRQQVFYLKDGRPFVPVGYKINNLKSDAGKANALSFAYLITGEQRYAEAARRWALFVSDLRVDYHLADRAHHDTVVYCYEYGLKGMALAFDRLYHLLTPAERAKLIAHIEYHGEAAHQWCRDRLKLHLNYQNSHGQQCMHALFTTTLAVATDSRKAAEWADYLIRQYVNRVAWGSNDGGYSEGQKYSHKVQFILEGLAALKTATGIDLFKKPRWQNTGDFWMYCMSLNYWWNHWGDCYSLLDPDFGSGADTYITSFLASMSQSRHVKWWSDTRICNPAHLPLWYLSGSGVRPKPPVDVPQARLFPEVGQLAAYDRFYDHQGSRIFFRSSQWGGHSHAHCDQNSFILHAGGEIMACDAGYYTYSGDTYHSKWSRTTAAHNSILVNGEGQPRGIQYKGQVSAFFNTPEYCFFVGDASGAYGDLLRKFHRAVLFLRPDVFIVYDELSASEPADYTCVLNAFEPAEIDEAARVMVVKQRHQRLLVRHLAPHELTYSQTNERPHPMKTRAWSRYTEAFPQHWNICVKTVEKKADERILAFMHAYDQTMGPRVKNVERIDAENALGVRFGDGDISETTLFRLAQKGRLSANAGDVETDGRAVSVRQGATGRVQRWLLHGGTRLTAGGSELLQAEGACDAAADFELSSAAAQICLRHPSPLRIRVSLPTRPRAIFAAPPNRPEQAKQAEFTWTGDAAVITVDGPAETVLWVDPVVDLSKPPPPHQLTITDSAGRYRIQLETAIADNGDVIAFAELSPREPGVYELTSDDPGPDLLIQDRWDPNLSARASGKVVGHLRDGVEVFARYAPDKTPDLRAVLRESHKGRIVNLLRNGNFEEGIPDYPPRGWTVQHPRTGDLGWPEWSQEDPAEGTSCLRFVRPRDRISLTAQPMRLRTAGRCVLRFKAKGTATHASVSVSGQRGASAQVQIEPGSDWREYRTELDVHPGYCRIAIRFTSGAEPDQVLWVDDMEFGRVGR